jgi:hypothetical protein
MTGSGEDGGGTVEMRALMAGNGGITVHHHTVDACNSLLVLTTGDFYAQNWGFLCSNLGAPTSVMYAIFSCAHCKKTPLIYGVRNSHKNQIP